MNPSVSFSGKIKNIFLQNLLTYGASIWLWSFLFARVPLAAIQDLCGLESRPLLLFNLLSIGFAFLSFSQVGFSPLKSLRLPVVFTGVLSFCVFWGFYLLRLGADQWFFQVEMVTSASSLFKDLLISTLIPALCLPWVIALAAWSSSLAILVAMGSLSVLLGELGFIYLNGVNNLFSIRFSFEDLNPIPAGHSSASLVIISSVYLLSLLSQSANKKRKLFILLAFIGICIGLFGLQLAMSKGAFFALIPLVVYVAYRVWSRFRGLGRIYFLAISASVFGVLFGAMKRNMWSPGSIGDRISLMVQSVNLFSGSWVYGVGFRAQKLLASNPETIKDHWYPHNLFAESLLIGGIFLAVPLICFTLSVLVASQCNAKALTFDGDMFQLPLIFLWGQGLISALFSGHLAFIPGFWVGGLLLLWNRSR